MPDYVKSLLVAAVLIFVMLVVLDGDIVRRTFCLTPGDPCIVGSFRKGVSYCDSWVAELPILNLMPCYALNSLVTVGLFVGLLGTVVAVIYVSRQIRG